MYVETFKEEEQDDKMLSCIYIKNINEEMTYMSNAFNSISSAMEQNLSSIQTYIRNLQTSNNHIGLSTISIEEIEKPKLNKLGNIAE